jgi:hypothetical protein
MTYISIALCFSVLLNGVLVWYARKLTKQFLFFAENTQDLKESLNVFTTHVNNIHELEMFYGDETLGALIKHASHIVEVVGEFHDSFALEEREDDDDGSP